MPDDSEEVAGDPILVVDHLSYNRFTDEVFELFVKLAKSVLEVVVLVLLDPVHVCLLQDCFFDEFV